MRATTAFGRGRARAIWANRPQRHWHWHWHWPASPQDVPFRSLPLTAQTAADCGPSPPSGGTSPVSGGPSGRRQPPSRRPLALFASGSPIPLAAGGESIHRGRMKRSGLQRRCLRCRPPFFPAKLTEIIHCSIVTTISHVSSRASSVNRSNHHFLPVPPIEDAVRLFSDEMPSSRARSAHYPLYNFN